MRYMLVGALLLSSVGCSAADLAASPPEGEAAGSEDAVLAAPIAMSSGAWWGDVATPFVNQVWGDVLNATPGKNLTAPYTFKWKCRLPVYPGSEQSLKLTTTYFSYDATVLKVWPNPTAEQVYSYTLDPAKLPAQWIEVRIRCLATETTGENAGLVTAITAGFPLQIRGGSTMTGQHHRDTNYVDTHGWYDRDVKYVYSRIENIGDVLGKPISGVFPFKLRSDKNGTTALDHFMFKIDGAVATMADGQPAEFHGTATDHTVSIDTTKLANGPHVIAMHAHGLETAAGVDAQPGKQLASQIEVTVDVEN